MYRILQEAVKGDKRSKKERLAPLVTTTSKMLFIRCQKMSALAKVNGLRLRLSGVPKSVINLFNNTCDCVSYGWVTKLMDDYAKNCTSIAKNWENQSVAHAGDNVDVRSSRRHETSGSSTLDMHFYNNILFKSRVDLSTVSDVSPSIPAQFSVEHYRKILPTTTDYEVLLNQLEPIVAQAWSTMDTTFTKYTATPPHQYSNEMSTVTEMVRHLSKTN